jgi:hypothetical protein
MHSARSTLNAVIGMTVMGTMAAACGQSTTSISSSTSGGAASTATTQTTSSSSLWLTERLAITQAYSAVFGVCPNPTNDRPPVVIRPATLDGCKPAIDKLRSIAARIKAELPQLDVTEPTRANIADAVTHFFERIDHFEQVELRGTDAEVINEHFDVNEFRQAGRL